MGGSMIDVAQAISEISEKLLDLYEYASPRAGLDLFRSEHADLLRDLGAELAEQKILDRFKDQLARKAGRNRSQLQFDGIGAVDPIITVHGGESGFRYKRIEKATADDLREDVEILVTNEQAATAARVRGQLRNEVLLPLMEEHGFVLAQEAFAYLRDNGS